MAPADLKLRLQATAVNFGTTRARYTTTGIERLDALQGAHAEHLPEAPSMIFSSRPSPSLLSIAWWLKKTTKKPEFLVLVHGLGRRMEPKKHPSAFLERDHVTDRRFQQRLTLDIAAPEKDSCPN